MAAGNTAASNSPLPYNDPANWLAQIAQNLPHRDVCLYHLSDVPLHGLCCYRALKQLLAACLPLLSGSFCLGSVLWPASKAVRGSALSN